MFQLHLTNSILTIQLTGLLPGLSIAITVEKPNEQPIKVDIRVSGEIVKP